MRLPEGMLEIRSHINLIGVDLAALHGWSMIPKVFIGNLRGLFNNSLPVDILSSLDSL
jgi:hypothetical protein